MSGMAHNMELFSLASCHAICESTSLYDYYLKLKKTKGERNKILASFYAPHKELPFGNGFKSNSLYALSNP